jgi:hypothetical protein
MTYSHPGFSGRIGVGSEEINPPAGIYARNWGAANEDTATGIHRPLFVKVLTLQATPDASPFVLASLDLGWWKRREDEYILRGGLIDALSLDSSRVLVNLSHTHAGPGLCAEDADLPGGELIAPYLEQVRDALIRAAQTALASATNGVLEWSQGRCDLARNRDLPDPERDRIVCGFNPNAVSDDTLLVGRACDDSGKTIAIISNYACHPTTLAWQNRLISPDWCGAFHELVESHTGATSIFLQGASGELQAKETYIGDTQIADTQGRQLGFAVLSVLEGMLPPRTQLEYSGVVESGAPLATWRRSEHEINPNLNAKQIEVELPLKSDLPTLQQIERDLAACDDRVMRERLARKRRVRATIGDGTSAMLPVWLWNVGDAIIVAHREEAYSDFQLELRARFPNKAIIVMNLTNGSCGYLTPQKLYDLDIYQVWQSPYERGCLERLTTAVGDAIEQA